MALKKIQYPNITVLIKENLIDEEHDVTAQRIKELKPCLKRGYLTKGELEIICRWKSARSIRLIQGNTPNTIKKVTKQVLLSKNDLGKIQLLTTLRGVGVPMASAILMLLNPKRYGVIDIRVWQLLYHMGTVKTNPSGKNISANEYVIFLSIIREFAKVFKVKTRDIERTLFYFHIKNHIGNLYSS